VKFTRALACGSAVLVLAAFSFQHPGGWREEGLASFDEAWQTIADTFYDPAFGGLDWNAVRADLRPSAEAASSPDDLRRVITSMLMRLKRSHFVLLSSSSTDADAGPIGQATVSIEIRITSQGVLVTRVDPGSSAALAGLSPGQLLISIDGTPVGAWRSSGSDPGGPIRALDLWRRAYRALHGDAGSAAALEVRLPDGSTRRITAARAREPGEIVALGNLPPLSVRTETRELLSPGRRRVGVIRFNLWMTAIDAPVAAAVDRFRRADGIVIDLRGNPGGLAGMMSGIAGHFLDDSDALLGRMQTRQMQLEFHPNPRLSTLDGRRVQPFAGPVGILVDELTGSTSECFTGAMQSLGRARVFGVQTMGEALPALTKRLPNGDVLMYAVGNFVTSSGRSLEGEGVIPDDAVPWSREALAAGRDPVMERALRWMDDRRPLQSRPGRELLEGDKSLIR
jgi:carboxyl-terminal processing protease